MESVRQRLLIQVDAIAWGTGDVGPVDAEFARVFCGADIFGALEANGVDEGVGHVGEGDGTAEGDAALASEFHELGDEGADFMDFGDFTEFGGQFGERVDVRSGGGVAAKMGAAENLAGPGYRLAALTAMLIDVAAEGERINDFRLLVSVFHFGTPVS